MAYFTVPSYPPPMLQAQPVFRSPSFKFGNNRREDRSSTPPHPPPNVKEQDQSKPKEKLTNDGFKSQLFEVLQCPVCHEVVENTHLCSKCHQHFCRDCIHNWVATNSSCPNCRARLTTKELIKYVRLDELQQTIQKFQLPVFCKKHERQQLSLFCYPCETSICVTCFFSESHVNHKDQIVLLDVAFQHFKQTLTETKDWTTKHEAEISKELSQAQGNVKRLIKEQDRILQLSKQSAKLVAGEADVHTIQKMLETKKTISVTRLQCELKKIPISCSGEEYFVSDPFKLTFRFTNFNKSMEEKSTHIAPSLNSYGFLWSSQIVKENGQFQCQLKLTQGKSSRYAIALEDHQEKLLSVEIGKSVPLGVVDLNAVDCFGNLEVAVRIRQTYQDRCKQLQDYADAMNLQTSE